MSRCGKGNERNKKKFKSNLLQTQTSRILPNKIDDWGKFRILPIENSVENKRLHSHPAIRLLHAKQNKDFFPDKLYTIMNSFFFLLLLRRLFFTFVLFNLLAIDFTVIANLVFSASKYHSTMEIL